MLSELEICNMAMAHLGTGKQIADLENERSQEAAACRMFYVPARDQTLRAIAWPFATKFADLGLVTQKGDALHPTDEWDYSYRYPSTCWFARRIPSGCRVDTHLTKVPYRLASDDQGKLILTDKVDAVLEYTQQITDTQLYDYDFCLTLSYRIAAFTAPQLTAGDPFKVGDKMLRLYFYELSKASAAAFNEEQGDPTPDSEMILTRDY